MNLLDDVLLRRTFWLCLPLLLLTRVALALWLPLAEGELQLIGQVYSPEHSAYPPLLNAWRSLPPQVVDVAIATNTPLLCFAFLSMACFYRGVRYDDHVKHIWAGLSLGLALLSDSFALLLGLAYLVFVFLSPRREQRWIDVSIVAACALGLLSIFIFCSPQHSWAQWRANVPHLEPSLSWANALLFLGAGLLAAGPFLLWQLGRAADLRRILTDRPGVRALWTLAVVPICVMGLLSLLMGLAWLPLHLNARAACSFFESSLCIGSE